MKKLAIFFLTVLNLSTAEVTIEEIRADKRLWPTLVTLVEDVELDMAESEEKLKLEKGSRFLFLEIDENLKLKGDYRGKKIKLDPSHTDIVSRGEKAKERLNQSKKENVEKAKREAITKKYIEASILNQFDKKTGMHVPLANLVVNSLYDPDSFRHLGTKYGVEDGKVEVWMKYSGTNLHGGRLTKTAVGHFTYDGKPTGQWYNYEDAYEEWKRGVEKRTGVDVDNLY